MASGHQPHLLTNPHLTDQAVLRQFESKLMKHIAGQLAVVRLSEANKLKVGKARKQWANGKASQ